MIDWTTVILALIAGLPATVAAVGALLATLRNGTKADRLETAVAHNTAVTKSGAATAANDAADAKVAVESIERKLNGGVLAAIEDRMRPIREAMALHSARDEAAMSEIRALLEQLRGKDEGGPK